jgi:N-sulfoglucosamine sulfohydrolase
MRSARPTNILLVTADDMNGDTPGCCGGPEDATPRIDGLAGEGALFRRAHVPIAVCQPSRSAMLTGRWPHRNGAEGFGPIADGVPLLTDLLRPAGYRLGISGKVSHLEPVERFGWDLAVGPGDLVVGRNPRPYGEAAAQFFADAAAGNRPWFLMANAHDPHRPFYGSEQERQAKNSDAYHAAPPPSRVFEADEAKVPGFLPDLPDVRRETAEYLSSSRRCDDVVGAVLDALTASGQEGNTLVVFLSDNGMAFPFAKANCYLQSTRTPLVIRWPGVAQPGQVDTAHFVSALDLFPTFCEAAGVEVPSGVDGRSLSGLVAGTPEADRDHIHTVFHETSAKRRYEMRCVQDGTFGYVWNAWADGIAEYRAENMDGLTWPAMQNAAAERTDVAARTDFYVRRPAEELYRLDVDPDCLTNLAGRAEYRDQQAKMRSRLGDWMATVDDPLAARYSSEQLVSHR